MSIQMMLLPVFVQVGLTFALLLWTRGGRGRSASDRAVANGPVATDEFGVPVLFYALIAIALPIRHVDIVILMLAWVFVVCRFAHAGFIVGGRDGGERGAAWLASVLVMLAMWLYFALKMLLLI
jgi:hypothetical protein